MTRDRSPLVSAFTPEDHEAFARGVHARLHDHLGAHLEERDGVAGTRFAVWAPHAASVDVIGDFCDWAPGALPMRCSAGGVWEAFVPGVGEGALYKFHIRSADGRYAVDKADPFGVLHQTPPDTASVVWRLTRHAWRDEAWMRTRAERAKLDAPVSIYELHLGSWMRSAEQGHRSLGYREIAPRLSEYVLTHGYTHVELMPVMEHPFGGSWGYQVTGYFAPSHRQGKPEDLMFLVDHLHQHGIGVILDWVPAHFPTDEHGLAYFDGTHLFEHADPRRGFHPDWRSFIFDYGRPEVRSFLLSSAMAWVERYHADGLRVDGVASMLYLDYSRAPGEWIPNEHGGRENLEAITLLRSLNTIVHEAHPDVLVIAEESTSFPHVTGVIREDEGLGFDFKWDLGWMHDALGYLQRDPVYRRYHHQEITFRSLYAASERFVLPLSHDEVVHGKGSLLNKMPGDRWQKFANLRLLFGAQFTQPGKKLLFMGSDFGQWREWDHDGSLDWHLLEDEAHAGLLRLVADLNRAYREERALHVGDCVAEGFRWVDGSDAERSVVAFLREGSDDDPPILCVLNFTPVVRYGYALGVPREGKWTEILNTDATNYGGSGVGNLGAVTAVAGALHGFDFQVEVTLPPLACVLLRAPTL